MQCARGTSEMEVNWNEIQDETPNIPWDQVSISLCASSRCVIQEMFTIRAVRFE